MFLLLYLLSFVFPSFAYAQGDLDPCTGGETDFPCTVSKLQIGGVLADIINFVFVIAVILALGFLVYGGIKWLTSGGDKDSVAGARGTIIAAIIGLIIIFLAYVILNFVLIFLGYEGGLAGISIPRLGGIETESCGERGESPCITGGGGQGSTYTCNDGRSFTLNTRPDSC